MALIEKSPTFGMKANTVEFELCRGKIKKVTEDTVKALKKAVKEREKRKGEAEGYVKDLNLGERVQELIRKGKEDAVADMVKGLNYCRNYSYTFFPVWLTCDRNILLTKLGFWGPAKDKRGSYVVTIRINLGGQEGDRYGHSGNLVYSSTGKVEARGKEVFTLTLEKPVLLPSLTWCKIQFQLEGPRTCISSSGSLPCSIYHKDSGANFQFYCNGSKQLPRIYYQLE